MLRIQINSTDVMLLMGVSKRTANRYLAEIRNSLDKKHPQKITVREFAQYFGFKEAEVREAMRTSFREANHKKVVAA